MTLDAVTKWFRSPHYAPAAIAARAAVNVATIIWSVIVLSREHALDSTRFVAYRSMLRIAPEDGWALLALLCSLSGMARLVAKSRPHWTSAIGYFLMMLFWNYLALSLLVYAAFPLPPATAAGITVVAGLSLYAFVSNPKSPGAPDVHQQ